MARTTKKYLSLTGCLWLCCALASAQPDASGRTFRDTRIINTQSVEMLAPRRFDLRIVHRFGDMLGTTGGWATFYGLENAADILVGFDYGITPHVMMGLYRTKGAGSRRQLLNINFKTRLAAQRSGMPFTLAATATASMSTMPRVDGAGSVSSFPEFSHRLAFAGQLLAARRVSHGLSVQLSTSVVHRNLVPHYDDNTIFAAGLATRIQLTKMLAILADVQVPLNGNQSPLTTAKHPDAPEYQVPLGIGFEIETGGHVFQINLTNSAGIMETDFIPETTQRWSEGRFRLGFTISRLFNL